MTDKLDALIARLEQAARGSRELDDEIAELCAPTDDARMAAFENGRDWPDLYTTSLDAALTLVPEGWRVEHIGQNWGMTRWDAELHTADDVPSGVTAEAPTPALALCIAALKARRGN